MTNPGESSIPSSTPSSLLTYATKQSLPPDDLRRVLSSTSSSQRTNTTTPLKLAVQISTSSTTISAHTVNIDGKAYRQINVHGRVQ